MGSNPSKPPKHSKDKSKSKTTVQDNFVNSHRRNSSPPRLRDLDRDRDRDRDSTFGPSHSHCRSSSRSRGHGQPLPQDPAVEMELKLTLEEVDSGCEKKQKLRRAVVDLDGVRTYEEKVLTIPIPPGCKTGTRVTFPREGNRIPGTIPADIVFVVKDALHPVFLRDGADLLYAYKIGVMEAGYGALIQIPTLHGPNIQLDFGSGGIKPDMEKVIRGKGLPVHGKPDQRGNLVVVFDIADPITTPKKVTKVET